MQQEAREAVDQIKKELETAKNNMASKKKEMEKANDDNEQLLLEKQVAEKKNFRCSKSCKI